MARRRGRPVTWLQVDTMQWKRIFQEPRMFFGGWIAAIVGSALILLLILFLALYPSRTYPVQTEQLPQVAEAPLPETAERIDVSRGGRIFIPGRTYRMEELENVFARATRYRVHTGGDTPWIVLRTLLVAMREQRVASVDLAVRTADKSVGALRIPLDQPLPPLDVHANVQAFATTLR